MEQRIVCGRDESKNYVAEGDAEARFIASFERILEKCGPQAREGLDDEALLRVFALITLWPCMQRSIRRQHGAPHLADGPAIRCPVQRPGSTLYSTADDARIVPDGTRTRNGVNVECAGSDAVGKSTPKSLTLAEQIARTISRVQASAKAPRSLTPSDMWSIAYPKLRQLARGMCYYERAGHTLPPTAVVNETYARFMDDLFLHRV